MSGALHRCFPSNPSRCARPCVSLRLKSGIVGSHSGKDVGSSNTGVSGYARASRKGCHPRVRIQNRRSRINSSIHWPGLHLCSVTAALHAHLSLLFDDELDDVDTSLLLHLILLFNTLTTVPTYESHHAYNKNSETEAQALALEHLSPTVNRIWEKHVR